MNVQVMPGIHRLKSISLKAVRADISLFMRFHKIMRVVLTLLLADYEFSLSRSVIEAPASVL